MSVYSNSKFWHISISLPEKCEVLCFLNLIILLKCNLKVAQARCFDIPLRGASCQSLNKTPSKITPQLLLLSPLIFKVGYFHREMVVLNTEQTNGQSWRYWNLRAHPGFHTDGHSPQGKKDEGTEKTTFMSVTLHDSMTNLLDIWSAFQRM